jgi:hypothetical protein
MKSPDRSQTVPAARFSRPALFAALALALTAGLPAVACGSAAGMAPAPAAAAHRPVEQDPPQQGGSEEAASAAREPSAGQEPAAAAPEPAGEDAKPKYPRTREEVEVPEGATSVDIAGFGVYIPPKPEVVEPPDGEWLVDSESGRRYFLKRLPKSETWSWVIDGTHIRHGGVGIYEVETELDDAFMVRVYDPTEGTHWEPERPPTAEELAAVAASFRAETSDSDRLRFTAIADGLPQRGQWRNGFDVADMNGDGHLDIVHGPARKGGPGTPVILLGDGAGGWRLWQEARFPSVRYAYGDARAADFDGDGHLDVALAQHLQGVQVLLGDGEGGFRLASAGLPWDLPGQGGDAGGFSSRALAVADWNGDGRPDLLALGEGPRPARESGAGTRGLLPSSSFGVAVFVNRFGEDGGEWSRVDQGLDFGQVFGDALAIGDFDGDGRLDFVTSSNVFGLRNLVGMGTEGGGWRYTEIEALRPQSFTKAVAAADFDGDGRDDLAVSQVSNQAGKWWHALDVLYSKADGWTRRTLAASEGRQGYASALAAGDLDGDGSTDLAAVTEGGEAWIFLGDGEGFFTREASPEVTAMIGGCTGYHVAIADVDGDGRGELIEAWAGEPSAMWDPGRCPSLGAIRAWDPQSAAPAVAAESGATP